jgi:tRNA (cytidine/uridine-2'-O-)-methyltransferase
MLHVVLYQPEIAPNTGNIMRLCANTGVQLHLIHPMGFALSDKACRRAGLDYRDMAVVTEHASMDAFLQKFSHLRLFACTTKASQYYSDVRYRPDDALVFGPETRGLPPELLASWPEQQIRIPMQPGSRSLNLSNATAVVVYEACRQLGFSGLS